MAGVQGCIPIRQPLEGGVLWRGQALKEEEGARGRKAVSPRVLHTVPGTGHPNHLPCPGLGVYLQRSGTWGWVHPLDRKVRGKINPLAEGSAPGSQREVETTRASGQVVSSTSLFPTACGHRCLPGTSKARPDQAPGCGVEIWGSGQNRMR